MILPKLKMSAVAPKVSTNCVKEIKFTGVCIGKDTYLASMYLDKIKGIIMHIVKKVGDPNQGENNYKVSSLTAEESEGVLSHCFNVFMDELNSCLAGNYHKLHFFVDRLQKEKGLPEEDRILTSLCAQIRPWTYNTFVSTFTLKDWIGRATEAAITFLKNKEQTKTK